MSNADNTQTSATSLDFPETLKSSIEGTESSDFPKFQSAHLSVDGSEDINLNSDDTENDVLKSEDDNIEEMKRLRKTVEVNIDTEKLVERNETISSNAGEKIEIQGEKNSSKKKKKKKKKKKAATESSPRIVAIDPDASIDYDTKTLYASSPHLPYNEYETAIKRRLHYISIKTDVSTDNKNASIAREQTKRKPAQTLPPKRTIFNNIKYSSSPSLDNYSLNGNTNKLSSASITTHSDRSNASGGDENTIRVLDKNEEQDYSLGMHLNIREGRVVVEYVNELKDGRASPAQVSGRIQRGDVLVKINSTSLREPGINLIDALGVLKATDTSTSTTQTTLSNYYFSRYTNTDEEEKERQREKQHLEFVEKELKLRFIIGEGLKLLDRKKPFELQPSTNPVDKMLCVLFGINYDEMENGEQINKDEVSKIIPENEEIKNERSIVNHRQNKLLMEPDVEMNFSPIFLMKPSKLTLQIISDHIAFKMLNDKWTSAYFQLDPYCSDLMKSPLPHLSRSSSDESKTQETNKLYFKSLSDLLEYGGKVMQGAGMLLDNIQNADESLSYGEIDSHLRSPGRKRFKQISNTGAILELNGDTSDDSADGLGDLTDDDDITVESLLITDAWKQQILYQLQQATDYTTKMNQQPVALAPTSMDSSIHGKPLSNEAIKSRSVEHTPKKNIFSLKNENEDNDSIALESLLFGGVEQAKSLTSQTKSLPPLHVTTSLYNMVMALERSVGNMTIDTTSSRRSNTMGESGIGRSVSSLSQRRLTSGRSITALMSKDRVRADKVYFLLKEALPLWLSTFSPLNVTLRRLLWPRTQVINNGMSFPDQGDDVSLISMGGVSSFSLGGSTYGGGKAKPWREIIEENKLDPTSRTQTCYLVTVYFTQKILRQANADSKNVFDFMKKFGAYLNLYTCLVAASNARMHEVVDGLLDIAKHDPHHDDAMTTISKKGALVFYDSGKLSALLERIKASVLDDDAIPLLTSAYPDLKPWQIKRYCVSNGTKKSFSFYYKYLSHLLHASDGHQKARHDRELVSEWCELTMSDQFISDYKNHFYEIVSLKNETLYYRDLPLFLKLSMKLSDIDLVLDLVKEILEHPKYRIKSDVILSVLDHIRVIGKAIMEQKNETEIKVKLERILQYLEEISKLKSDTDFENIHVSDQLYYLLESCLNSSSTISQQDFIEILSDHGRPNDVLTALEKWREKNETDISSFFYFGILQKLLKRAARESYQKKSTGVLLRLQKAREMKKKNLESNKSSSDTSFIVKVNSESFLEYSSGKSVSIWEKLQHGECVIDK